jgi:hypothetical protein
MRWVQARKRRAQADEHGFKITKGTNFTQNGKNIFATERTEGTEKCFRSRLFFVSLSVLGGACSGLTYTSIAFPVRKEGRSGVIQGVEHCQRGLITVQ